MEHKDFLVLRMYFSRNATEENLDFIKGYVATVVNITERRLKKIIEEVVDMSFVEVKHNLETSLEKENVNTE